MRTFTARHRERGFRVRFIGVSVALVGLLTLVPSSSLADCGSSRSGSSSGGSTCDYLSSDSSSEDDGGSSVPLCVSTSHTVGFDECRRFGQDWSFGQAPSLQFTLSPFVQRVVLTDVSFAGTSDHEDNLYHYGVGGRSLDQSEPLVGGVRLAGTILVEDVLYLGFEGQFGAGPSPGPTRSFGEGTFTPHSTSILGGGALVGAGIGLGDFSLRLEVLLGGRAVLLSGESVVGSCTTNSVSSVAQGIVEPRAAIEVFLLPNVSLGAYFGSNLLSMGDLHGGLSLRFHTRSYDGISGR